MLQLSSDLFLRCENCKRIIHIPRRRLYVEKAQHLINDDGVGMVSVYTIEGTPRCPSCRSEFSYVITALEFTENVVDDITAKAEGAMFLTEPEFTPEQRGNSNQTQRPQSLIDSVVHIAHMIVGIHCKEAPATVLAAWKKSIFTNTMGVRRTTALIL